MNYRGTNSSLYRQYYSLPAQPGYYHESQLKWYYIYVTGLCCNAKVYYFIFLKIDWLRDVQNYYTTNHSMCWHTCIFHSAMQKTIRPTFD